VTNWTERVACRFGGIGISRQVDTSEPAAIAGVSTDAMIAAHAVKFPVPVPRAPQRAKTQSVSSCAACGDVRFTVRLSSEADARFIWNRAYADTPTLSASIFKLNANPCLVRHSSPFSMAVRAVSETSHLEKRSR
jgi:hypothetical protein